MADRVYYEGILLNPTAHGIVVWRRCGHKHRSLERAKWCARKRWGNNHYIRVLDNHGNIVEDTNLPMNEIFARSEKIENR